jgi:hypothetical protein
MEIRKYLEDQIRLWRLSLASPLTDEDRMKINKPTDIQVQRVISTRNQNRSKYKEDFAAHVLLKTSK